MHKAFGYFLLLILSCSDYSLNVKTEKNDPATPIIQVTPEELIITDIDAGCDTTQEFVVKNIGNGILEISDIEYYITLPVNFSYDIDEATNGPLPWRLSSDEEKTFTITYTPTDDLGDNAFIEIASNDSSSPTRVNTEGLGDYYGWVTDEFEQETLKDVDILFVVDNSGSMNRVQTSLANNFDIFINIFAASGVDYHIAFITTDSSDLVGEVVTQLFADPIGEANSQINSIGTTGSHTEKGIERSYDALRGTGGAAPGTEFFREDAKLVIIYISDEDDHGNISPSVASSYFLALKTSSTYVTAHSVIGDVPNGCGTAQPGFLYDEIAILMSGTSLSICSSDWGTPMEQLAVESMVNNTFNLSDNNPVEQTIEVTVDGVISYDWSYDSIYNTIIFDVMSIPQNGQTIEINYAIFGECL
jgi:hypothetical protein